MTELTNQQRVDAEARAVAGQLIVAVEPDTEEPITRSDVYEVEALAATRYMLGGGGPTSYAYVIHDTGNDPLVIVDVVGWGEVGHVVIHGRNAALIALALAAAAKES